MYIIYTFNVRLKVFNNRDGLSILISGTVVFNDLIIVVFPHALPIFAVFRQAVVAVRVHDATRVDQTSARHHPGPQPSIAYV